MIVFVSGGAKNGKSSFAQSLAVKLARGGKRYYLATMMRMPSCRQGCRPSSCSATL